MTKILTNTFEIESCAYTLAPDPRWAYQVVYITTLTVPLSREEQLDLHLNEIFHFLRKSSEAKEKD